MFKSYPRSVKPSQAIVTSPTQLQAHLMHWRTAASCKQWCQTHHPESLGTTKCLVELMWGTGSPLGLAPSHPPWQCEVEPCHNSPLSVLLIAVVSVVEDHRVPGYISGWPHHSHLLHLNPGRNSSAISKTLPLRHLLRRSDILALQFWYVS